IDAVRFRKPPLLTTHSSNGLNPSSHTLPLMTNLYSIKPGLTSAVPIYRLLPDPTSVIGVAVADHSLNEPATLTELTVPLNPDALSKNVTGTGCAASPSSVPMS